MDTKIFLKENDSKKSVSTNSSLDIRLGGKRKLLPSGDFSYEINEYDEYVKERTESDKLRLTCKVNTLCSNVLFNKITEIVRDEGSDKVILLNYGFPPDFKTEGDKYKDVLSATKYKGESYWSGNTINYVSSNLGTSLQHSVPLETAVSQTKSNYTAEPTSMLGEYMHTTNAIRDMQLTKTADDGEHFVYHCGIDILNNHLIRSKTFKPICKISDDVQETVFEQYTAFNTIADVMRGVYGDKVLEKMYYPVNAGLDGCTKFIVRHLYEYDDIYPFEEIVKKTITRKYNGWLGFTNASKVKSYSDFDKSEMLDIERPIMYKNGGDFIDMYPSRDLYSFVPKWNKYRNRAEKNWNYCVTYPSSSVTKGFEEFIETNEGLNALKAIYIDENTKADNDAKQTVIYSISKHGLKKGDYVNVYKTYEVTDDDTNETFTLNELSLNSVKVNDVIDDYIFTVLCGDNKMCDSWIEFEDGDLNSSTLTISSDDVKGGETEYKVDMKSRKYIYKEENGEVVRYYVVNGKYANVDDTAQRISYKKVVGGVECDYYVRVFSKIPNFKFASGGTKWHELYNDGGKVISDYQTNEFEFESHIGRLAFAKNVYGDDIGEVVFTDDIDLGGLKDNLGRPLSSVYFTIIKNNRGYKEWYGFDESDTNWDNEKYDRIRSENVEFSHCFGKVSCGFEMSDESIYGTSINNIKVINNGGLTRGYNCSLINEDDDRIKTAEDDEVWYWSDKHFYGDLACYDTYNAIETSIQPILHRFNTAQRESIRSKSNLYFSSYAYDDIYNDDYDKSDRYLITTNIVNGANKKHEGYYYAPHYEIRLNTFGVLESVSPTFLSVRSLVTTPSGTRVAVKEEHFLSIGDMTSIYDAEREELYYCETIGVENENVFVCKIYDEEGKLTDKVPDIFSTSIYKGDYRLFKIDNIDAPSYAKILKDGTCRVIWRKLIKNGLNRLDKSVSEYPFTNGAFYVNLPIELYLRRQDPYDMYGLYSNDDLYGEEMDVDQENNYAKEEEIEC